MEWFPRTDANSPEEVQQVGPFERPFARTIFPGGGFSHISTLTLQVDNGAGPQNPARKTCFSPRKQTLRDKPPARPPAYQDAHNIALDADFKFPRRRGRDGSHW
jgi:hypothetical protein